MRRDMGQRIRFAAAVVVLLAAALVFATTLVAASCEDDCATTCDDCGLCLPPGSLAHAADIAPVVQPSEFLVPTSADGPASPSRAIGHVPLRLPR